MEIIPFHYFFLSWRSLNGHLAKLKGTFASQCKFIKGFIAGFLLFGFRFPREFLTFSRVIMTVKFWSPVSEMLLYYYAVDLERHLVSNTAESGQRLTLKCCLELRAKFGLTFFPLTISILFLSKIIEIYILYKVFSYKNITYYFWNPLKKLNLFIIILYDSCLLNFFFIFEIFIKNLNFNQNLNIFRPLISLKRSRKAIDHCSRNQQQKTSHAKG